MSISDGSPWDRGAFRTGALVLAAAFGLTRSGFAQTPPAVAYVPAAPPSHVAVGTQYYDADLGGFREYLESIRDQDPSVYSQLDPDLSSLETQATAGKIVGWGSLAAGAGLMLFALHQGSKCDEQYPGVGDDWLSCQKDARNFIYAGVGVGLAGALVGFMVLPPGRSDFLSFVNRHNRVNPGSPMRLNLGYAPSRTHGFASVTFDFDLGVF